jgi:hypothetical protein
MDSSDDPRTARRIMPFRPHSPAVVKATLAARLSAAPAVPAPSAEIPVRLSLPLADVLFSQVPDAPASEPLRVSSMAWPVAPVAPRPIAPAGVQWLRPPAGQEAHPAPAARPARRKRAPKRAATATTSPARIAILALLIIAALCAAGILAMHLVSGRDRPARPAITSPD